MPDLSVAIAGAGLAGLALAHHLHRHGVAVIVYERDTDLTSRDPGYRLHINSTGSSVLSAVLEPRLWDLFVALAPRDRRADRSVGPGHGAATGAAQRRPDSRLAAGKRDGHG